jgi:hypothetical protein
MIVKIFIFCLVLVYGSNQPIHPSEAKLSIEDLQFNKSNNSLDSILGRLKKKDFSDHRRRYEKFNDSFSEVNLLREMERPQDDYYFFTY